MTRSNRFSRVLSTVLGGLTTTTALAAVDDETWRRRMLIACSRGGRQVPRMLFAIVSMLGSLTTQAAVVGTINVGQPALRVEVLSEYTATLGDRITIQATNSSSTTYVCTGRIGFFDLRTGASSAFAVHGEGRVPPGGPWVIVATENKRGSGLGNTLAYDSASCTPATTGGGGSNPSAEVRLVGELGFSIDPPSSLVRLTAQEIRNPSPSRTTGTLRLELWALDRPYGSGGATGRQIAASRLPPACTDSSGRLAPGTTCRGIVLNPTYAPPPPGSYAATMVLTEYSTTCTTNGGFCVVDYFNFSGRLTIEGGGTIAGNSGGIELNGAGSYQVDFNTGVARLNLEAVNNRSASRTTGTLRLELWALSSEYQGGDVQNAYRLFTSRLPSGCSPELGPRQGCTGIVVSGPLLTRPPQGSYFVTVFVTEYDLACTSADRYCIATSRNGIDKLTVPPVASTPPPASNPPPPSTNPPPSGGGGGSEGGGGATDPFLVVMLALLMALAVARRGSRCAPSRPGRAAIQRAIPAGVVALLTTSAHGTTLLHQSFDDLVQKADGVLVGTVAQIEPRRGPDGEICTFVTLNQLEVLKGSYSGNAFTLRMMGGQVGNEGLRIDGSPEFAVDERVLLFVHGNGTNFVPVVGWTQGVFRLTTGRTGIPEVRDHDGNRIYGVSGGRLEKETRHPAEVRVVRDSGPWGVVSAAPTDGVGPDPAVARLPQSQPAANDADRPAMQPQALLDEVERRLVGPRANRGLALRSVEDFDSTPGTLHRTSSPVGLVPPAIGAAPTSSDAPTLPRRPASAQPAGDGAAR